MKVAVITDLHFGVKNFSSFMFDEYMKFYEDVFIPHLKNHKIKNVLILGDTWDKRTILNIQMLNQVHERLFDVLRDMGIDVYMILGNHDVYYKNTNKYNSVAYLEKMYDNVKVIHTHEVIELDGHKFGMISWINNENVEESVEWIKTVDCDTLCGHFEINGFEMTRGKFCDGGFKIPLFERFDRVWSGHFHIKSNNSNISYLGNPHWTTWGDYGQRKGFHIFDTKTHELDFIDNPYNLYIKVFYDDNMDLTNHDFSLYNSKIVRVLINSRAIQNKQKFDLFMECMSSSGVYMFDIVDTESTSVEDASNEIDYGGEDTVTLIEMYMSTIKIDPLEPTKLNDIFMEIYKEALELSLDDIV